MVETDAKTIGSFVRLIVGLLRGDLRPSEYGKTILPFVILCRSQASA